MKKNILEVLRANAGLVAVFTFLSLLNFWVALDAYRYSINAIYDHYDFEIFFQSGLLYKTNPEQLYVIISYPNILLEQINPLYKGYVFGYLPVFALWMSLFVSFGQLFVRGMMLAVSFFCVIGSGMIVWKLFSGWKRILLWLMVFIMPIIPIGTSQLPITTVYWWPRGFFDVLSSLVLGLIFPAYFANYFWSGINSIILFASLLALYLNHKGHVKLSALAMVFVTLKPASVLLLPFWMFTVRKRIVLALISYGLCLFIVGFLFNPSFIVGFLGTIFGRTSSQGLYGLKDTILQMYNFVWIYTVPMIYILYNLE